MSIARSIYNEFKIPDKDLMSYMAFIEKCKNLKQPNDFFEFQNNYLDLLSKKLVNNEEERKRYKDILLEDDKRQKEYVRGLNACKSMDKIFNNNNRCMTENNELRTINPNKNEIKNNASININNYNTLKTESNNRRYEDISINDDNNLKKNNYNSCTISYDNRDTFSHYQPTFNFIDLMYKDSRKYLDRYKDGVKELSPIPVIRDKNDSKKLKNLRFLGGINHKVRSTILSYDMASPGYIGNKERFNRNDIASEEKKMKLKNIENINKKKNEILDKWNDIIDFQQKISEVKESLGQIKRTKNLFDYENRIYERNKLQ